MTLSFLKLKTTLLFRIILSVKLQWKRALMKKLAQAKKRQKLERRCMDLERQQGRAVPGNGDPGFERSPGSSGS